MNSTTIKTEIEKSLIGLSNVNNCQHLTIWPSGGLLPLIILPSNLFCFVFVKSRFSVRFPRGFGTKMWCGERYSPHLKKIICHHLS